MSFFAKNFHNTPPPPSHPIKNVHSRPLHRYFLRHNYTVFIEWNFFVCKGSNINEMTQVLRSPPRDAGELLWRGIHNFKTSWLLQTLLTKLNSNCLSKTKHLLKVDNRRAGTSTCAGCFCLKWNLQHMERLSEQHDLCKT